MSYDNYSDDGAICPHCHHLMRVHDDNYELFKESTCTWWCDQCEEEFLVAVHIQHSWTTALKGQQHDK